MAAPGTRNLAVAKKHARAMGRSWRVGCGWSLRTAEVRPSGPSDPVLGGWQKIQTYVAARGSSTLESLRLGHGSQLLSLPHSMFNCSANPVGSAYRMYP